MSPNFFIRNKLLKPIYINKKTSRLGLRADAMKPAQKKLKIQTAAGHYIIDSWDDILSLRVCVPEERARDLYLRFHFKCISLKDTNKLKDMYWIDDKEYEMDDLTCITRRWALDGSFIFIPNSPEPQL